MLLSEISVIWTQALWFLGTYTMFIQDREWTLILVGGAGSLKFHHSSWNSEQFQTYNFFLGFSMKCFQIEVDCRSPQLSKVTLLGKGVGEYWIVSAISRQHFALSKTDSWMCLCGTTCMIQCNTRCITEEPRNLVGKHNVSLFLAPVKSNGQCG